MNCRVAELCTILISKVEAVVKKKDRFASFNYSQTGAILR